MSNNNDIEFGFKTVNESPGYLLWQVTMLWQRMIKKELDELNITHTQFVLMSVLAWLSKNNEAVTQVDIANQSKTDRMMVSKVLRTLESKKYISRVEHKTDTRAKTVALTDEGKEILQRAILKVEKVDRDFFGIMRTEQSITSTFRSLIEKNESEKE